jgi:hypothetical protein
LTVPHAHFEHPALLGIYRSSVFPSEVIELAIYRPGSARLCSLADILVAIGWSSHQSVTRHTLTTDEGIEQRLTAIARTPKCRLARLAVYCLLISMNQSTPPDSILWAAA